MLYKKNSSQILSDDLFRNPTSEYRGAPFWSWNCKLDKNQLLRQMEQLKEMGFGGAHIHTRTGLDTEYMGDEYMQYVRDCCNKAEDENMLIWLYDEDRWSSGPAGGKVTRHKPFRRKRLMLFSEDKGWNTPKEKALESGEPYLLSCYDVVLDSNGYLADYRRIGIDAAAQGTKWYAYVVNEKESPWFNNQTYVDAMDTDAISKFVEITHERFKQCVGDKFNTVIPSIFTDEPNANHEFSIAIPTPDYTGRILYGWSRRFEEKYFQRYGADILDTLPELFWIKKDHSDSISKYRYFDFTAEMFSQNFSKQIGDWCRDNGIGLTGHLLHEESLLNQAITCGETMRSYGYFGIPGIDILCDGIELSTAKQAQSCVHQYGKEAMLSELYGVTNWDFDFRGHKFQGDWQAVLGVTVRVPHLSWLSMQGEAKRDYPAAIGYQSPWYKEYPIIENHFARVNTAMTRGKAVVRVGVIHPVESVWIYTGPSSQTSTTLASLEQNFQNITRWLLQTHNDFDYICESTLPSLTREDPRAVGEMTYDTIIVPGNLSIRSSTIAYLKKFVKAGGRLLFTGKCPEYVDGVKSDQCQHLFEISEKVNNDCASVSEALENSRLVRLLNSKGKAAQNLIYALREDTDSRWLFVAHSARPTGNTRGVSGLTQHDVLSAENIEISVKGHFKPVLYDTMTGKITPVPYRYDGAFTVLNREMNAFDSVLLKLEKDCDCAEVAETAEADEIIQAFDIKNAVDYTLDEPNVLLLDQAQYAFDDGDWCDTEEVLRIDNKFRELLGYPMRTAYYPQPYTMPKQPETHLLRLKYRFDSEIEYAGAFLAIENAENITVHLNGTRVENQTFGYYTDESIRKLKLPVIQKGENIMDVVIPFGQRTNVEWCYILGEFGVRVCGCESTIISRQSKIGFGDICTQGMPFYGANINYAIPVDMPIDGKIKVHTSYYRGSLVGVTIDGKRVGSIVLPPYDCIIENVTAGKHLIELTLFGNRHNSFGALHWVNEIAHWFGPRAWRTVGDDWCYEYKVHKTGILKSPIITILK